MQRPGMGHTVPDGYDPDPLVGHVVDDHGANVPAVQISQPVYEQRGYRPGEAVEGFRGQQFGV